MALYSFTTTSGLRLRFGLTSVAVLAVENLIREVSVKPVTRGYIAVMELSENAAEQVMRVNDLFYEAFYTSDLDAMSKLWEHSERVSCIHPSRPILRGWPLIRDSWQAEFERFPKSEVILTNATLAMTSNMAWVSLDEDVLIADGTATLAVTNIFARDSEDRWLMVVHHVSWVK